MSTELQRAALLGLGEAGSEIARDLLAAGVQVRAYDPDPARQVSGVTAATDEADAVTGAQIVFSVNWSRVSLEVARRVQPAFQPQQVYAELNTSSPDKKRAVAEVFGPAALVADVALMSPVPGRGLRTPMLISGPGARAYAELLAPLNSPVTLLEGPVGLAASRKLARSVFFKGLAAAVGEALEAARRLGPDAEAAIYADIARTLSEADAGTVQRLQEGSRLHAVRREEEMGAAAEMLRSLGVEPLMADATRSWLHHLAQQDGDHAR